MLEGLLSEFDTMMSLRHPNVLLTMGIALDAAQTNTAGIVTELMQASLFDVIYDPSFRPYASWEASYLALASDVAKGMSFIHFSGLLHRDLKPANVLIDARWIAKVADFGAVRDRKGGVSYDVEEVMGTPPYMAPEILQSHQYEPATDVWAFGCVLSHMGTAKIPYQQLQLKNRNELFDVIRGGEVSPIVMLFETANTPAGILDLAKACCTPDTKQRPTFQTIAEQLNAMLGDDDDAESRPMVRIRNRKAVQTRVSVNEPATPPTDRVHLACSGASMHATYKSKFKERSKSVSERGSDGTGRALSHRSNSGLTDRGGSPGGSGLPSERASFVDTFSQTMLKTFTPGDAASAEEEEQQDPTLTVRL